MFGSAVAPASMSHVARNLITWSLLASLVASAGIGEGLHFIPGCGHGITEGNRVLLLGISAASHRHVHDDIPRAHRADGHGVPVYDEDQCAICSVVGQAGTPDGPDGLAPALPLIADLTEFSLVSAILVTARCFQPRAPPAG